MKVKLPDGEKIHLEDICSYQKKEFIVCNLLNEWNLYIDTNWKKGKVKHFLNVLGTYLINHKEVNNKFKNNKYILSPYKMKNMRSFKAKVVPFSSLDEDDQVLIGHIDYDERKKNEKDD